MGPFHGGAASGPDVEGPKARRKKTMPSAARALDTAQPLGGEDGGRGQRSEAGAGLRSPDVIIDNQAALRGAGDAGPGWQASGGSTGVFIDGQPALRLGDPTQHGAAAGEIVQGSPHVLIGDRRPGTPRQRPHDTSVALSVTDALQRPLSGVSVSVLCPHDQRPAETIDGPTTIGGLCSAATVTVHKALQAGTWDEGASRGAHPQVTTRKVPLAKAAGTSPTLAPTGGVEAPSDLSGSGGGSGAGSGAPTGVKAPAPSSTPTGGASVHVPKASGPTTVVVPTTHNWVELVYEAFGQKLPTGKGELALLGVRGASLAPAAPKTKTPESTLEAEAAAGDYNEVDDTADAHSAKAYGDLLFCVWTDTSVHHTQHVDVFECTIDDSRGPGTLRLPFLLEGKLLHATPGPFDHAHPGSDVTLHVFEGAHEPVAPEQISPESVIALGLTQKGITEWPPGSNDVKFATWYGLPGESWCAMFVSWCFSHAGMPLIHYAYCPTGAGEFQNGAWGEWLGMTRDFTPQCKAGDIVFYAWGGLGTIIEHTGIVISNNGSTITTVEGNTTPPGGTGDQGNGGGVYVRTRDYLERVIIAGFGRPRYPRPVVVPSYLIRPGSEAGKVTANPIAGCTVLHHHYYRTEHGKQVPDPAATRYRRFLGLFNHATNKKEIPYLIVSSRYVESYAEWVTALAATPAEKPTPASVILASGLVAPDGHAGHYLPSFLSKAYADAVLKRASEMHDKKAAAEQRAALLGALFQVKG